MNNTKKAVSLIKRTWVETGKDTTSKILGFKAIKEGADFISESVSRLANPKKYARVETFEQAVERLGVNDDDLKQNRYNFILSFYISIFFVLVCFGMVNYNFFIASYLLGGLASFSIMLVICANAFKFSFRAYQIKKRRLGGLAEFYKTPNEWFPKLNQQ